MIERNPEFFATEHRAAFSYDCGINFYSTKGLMSLEEGHDFDIDPVGIFLKRIYRWHRVNRLNFRLNSRTSSRPISGAVSRGSVPTCWLWRFLT